MRHMASSFNPSYSRHLCNLGLGNLGNEAWQMRQPENNSNTDVFLTFGAGVSVQNLIPKIKYLLFLEVPRKIEFKLLYFRR